LHLPEYLHEITVSGLQFILKDKIMNTKNLIYNTFYFRKWSEKSKNKFFDILKTEILRVSKKQLIYLHSTNYKV